MIEDLQVKSVITGASTGIGAAAAVAFGRNKAKVVVHYNSSELEANNVAKQVIEAGGEAIIMRGDVRDSKVCQQLVKDTVKHFGEINVLINNAGGLIERRTVEEIDESLSRQ